MKKELQIQINEVNCVTDCWIYNRLAIIKTTPYYKDWIASHYNLYATDVYNFHFGDINMYSASYHEEILQRKSANLFKLTSKNMIEEIKNHIEDDCYVIINIKTPGVGNGFHECLIYGFDDFKEMFLAVALNGGMFQAIEVSYLYMKENIDQVKKHFLKNSQLGMYLSKDFQYPFTVFKLNSNYKIDNCVFEAFHKIRSEVCGKQYDECDVMGFEEYQSVTQKYTGISCLDAFKKMLSNVILGGEFKHGFLGIVPAAKKC